MQLNPDDFNRFLTGIGQLFSWRKSFVCPCVSPATNSPAPSCPHCHGKGFLWAAAVTGVAGVPSQKVQREFAKFGQWESGDMMLTIGSDSPLYDMGERDRVVMLNGDDPFSINLRKGFNDKLPWQIKQINRVFWINGVNLIEGSIPTQQTDGTLVFGATGAPPAGTYYSVSGTKYSEYFVFQDFPSDRPEHMGMKLPKKAQLRRFDLFGR
jgi:hypothetical protein